MTSHRIPIQQATHYLPSFNQRTKTTNYTPATGKLNGDWKVVRADVVRYGRNLFKSGAREGEVETDYDRMEPPPQWWCMHPRALTICIGSTATP